MVALFLRQMRSYIAVDPPAGGFAYWGDGFSTKGLLEAGNNGTGASAPTGCRRL